jgi:hypothetical protein
MQVPARGPVPVSALEPVAVNRYLPAAVEMLQQTADPALELMCSITSALRLYPQTSTAPGLNPYHVALTDVTVSSSAIQGHVARIAEGERSPQLQQTMVYDTMSWPLLQAEMEHNWDLYRQSLGQVLGALPRAVNNWNRQISQGYCQANEAIQSAIGPQQFRQLVPTVWPTIGMNRF